MVLNSIQQCDDNGFIRQCPMPIRGAGLHSPIRGKYLQDVLGEILVWDLVVLLVRTFNIESSRCMMRSKKASYRETVAIVLHMNYSSLQDRGNCTACYRQITCLW